MSRKIHDFAAANPFVIGTVGMLPYLFIAKNDIGNIPPVQRRPAALLKAVSGAAGAAPAPCQPAGSMLRVADPILALEAGI